MFVLLFLALFFFFGRGDGGADARRGNLAYGSHAGRVGFCGPRNVEALDPTSERDGRISDDQMRVGSFTFFRQLVYAFDASVAPNRKWVDSTRPVPVCGWGSMLSLSDAGHRQ